MDSDREIKDFTVEDARALTTTGSIAKCYLKTIKEIKEAASFGKSATYMRIYVTKKVAENTIKKLEKNGFTVEEDNSYDNETSMYIKW